MPVVARDGAAPLADKLNFKLNNRVSRSSAPRKPSRPRRAAGRPAGEAPDLRERLLDAALHCFARRGIAATSLRAIATEAEVNPALVHYYFGDKAQLQDAVVEERVMPLFERMGEVLQRDGEDVGPLVAAFVHGMHTLIEQHPWFPPLWVREVLCEGGAMRELVQHMAPRLPTLLAQRFDVAQRQGRLNPALDPRLLVVSLVGLTLFPAAGAPVWRHIFFDADDIDAERLRDHTMALLEQGIGTGGKLR